MDDAERDELRADLQHTLDLVRQALEVQTSAFNRLVELQQPGKVRRFLSHPAVVLSGIGTLGALAMATIDLKVSVATHDQMFTAAHAILIPNAWANFEALADGQDRMCLYAGRPHGLVCVRTPIKPIQPVPGPSTDIFGGRR